MSKLIEPRLDRVPDALASLNQWVVWKAVEITKRDGSKKITKIPYDPKNGHKASTQRRNNWGSFDDACGALLSDEYQGIGFVFTPDDDLVGIDLDNCFNEDGSLRADAEKAMNTARSFTERSPSGNGIHIICKGRLPGAGHCDNKTGREMYQEGRFFTITADVLGDYDQVAENTEAVRTLYDEWFGQTSYQDYSGIDLNWDDTQKIIPLEEMPVSDYVKRLVSNGEGMDDFQDKTGSPDRSLALFFVCREMTTALVPKESILTCLTDENYYLAGAALERRGNLESARAWVWKYTLAKVIAKWEEDRALFDDFDNDDWEGDSNSTEGDIDSDNATPKPKISRKEFLKGLEFEKGDHEKNAHIFRTHVCPVVRIQKQYLMFNGKYWEAVDDEDVEAEVQKAMNRRGFPMSTVNNTITTVRRFSNRGEFKPKGTIVTLQNGCVDLAGWDMGLVDPTVLPHSREHYSTSMLEFNYDPSATCPQWLAFLDEISESEKEWIELLQDWCGYCLVDDYGFQKMMSFVGKSRSGKGTILNNIIPALVGRAAFASTSLSNLAGDFGLESLLRKKVAVIGDAHHGTRDRISRAKEVLLGVTGNDHMPINRKNKTEITEQLGTRLMISSNEPPRFADSMDALANRTLTLYFNKSFVGREDPTLAKRLLTELPGIFNWAVAGLIRLGMRGYFVEPASSQPKKDETLMIQNPVRYFSEKYVIRTDDTNDRVAIREMYDAYTMYCHASNTKVIDRKWFGRRFQDLHDKIKVGRLPTQEGRHKAYLGMKINWEALHDFTEDDD